ncbi:MAG: trypsin-like serine peptidase, partial [Acidobacteriota bacterium]
AERYAAARALPGARQMSDAELRTAAMAEIEDAAEADAAITSAPGAVPTLRSAELAVRLYPTDAKRAAGARSAPARGTAKQPYTSAGLVPVSADQSYPYIAAGRLYFDIGSSTYYCSAAAIRSRIVVTAGNCVHSGRDGQAGFYDNFQFVPAYRDGTAPFGAWDYSAVFVTTTWYAGGGRVPNAADYAMLEMDDQTVGGSLQRLGEVVGYLGYQVSALKSNHVHILGYTSVFDDGQRLHQVTSGSYKAIGQNSVQYGGDMRGGSQGGPWIQDFGPDAARARVVGVTSSYPSRTGLNTMSSSIPDSRFTSLLNAVCAHRAGNC